MARRSIAWSFSAKNSFPEIDAASTEVAVSAFALEGPQFDIGFKLNTTDGGVEREVKHKIWTGLLSIASRLGIHFSEEELDGEALRASAPSSTAPAVPPAPTAGPPGPESPVEAARKEEALAK